MKTNNLESYLTKSAKHIVGDILKASLSYPKASQYLLQYKKYSDNAALIRNRFEKKNEHIPPFLIASITNACNLHCKGCFARANQSCFDEKSGDLLTSTRWGELFLEAKELGIGFILLIGGEPLLREDIMKLAGEIPQILFPFFTNATLLSEEYLTLLDEKRNLIPILSIEGNKETTNYRRGEGIYETLEATMKRLKERHILFATSITVTSQNINEVIEKDFIENLSKSGCKSILYIEYVPTSSEDITLALTQTQRDLLDETVKNMRLIKKNFLFLSFPGDEKAIGGCLAAGRGFFHINATGNAEPCPFSPYSDTNLSTHSIRETLKSPLFHHLDSSGMLLKEHVGGCSLYAQQADVANLLERGIV